jgi:hypothetical protein
MRFESAKNNESSNARYFKYKDIDLAKYEAVHQAMDLSDLELELNSLEQHLSEVIKVQPEEMAIAGDSDGSYFIEDDTKSTFDEFTEFELEIAMSNKAKSVIQELIRSKSLKKAA